ncbi:MAG TPA: TlpA disulfide reductase family protein [Thiobacillaceae bacterium]|nr:TlpA disulfide reductase family protein [Thiobacillaceae bacterium]
MTLALLGLIAYLWFRPPAWVEERVEPAPDVAIAGVAGAASLADLRGKVVLVNFWATWCPYCRHEMPAMQEFYDEHRGRGFEIVAFSTDEDAAAVGEFMAEKGYSFPAPMADAAIQRAFGGVSRLPTSFVIDRRGMIRHKVSGQVHYGRLRDLVGPLLEEAPTGSGRS